MAQIRWFSYEIAFVAFTTILATLLAVIDVKYGKRAVQETTEIASKIHSNQSFYLRQLKRIKKKKRRRISIPSATPSETPSTAPSSSSLPTHIPTISANPSAPPTSKPSFKPSEYPSLKPSFTPSEHPSLKPSFTPSELPSTSVLPSGLPTTSPSFTPSVSLVPSGSPTRAPSFTPSVSLVPSGSPTTSSKPSATPTSAPTFVDYFPGELTVKENGLLLSTGLTSKIIAETGKQVQLTGKKRKNRYSKGMFHGNPDGAAVFQRRESEGWLYVSNSEVRDGKGGVGVIRFNAEGKVTNYEMVLKKTSRNCSGGKSPWNTWISCEENGKDGQIWEVDPFGEREARKTVLGGDGGNFEAVVVDYRNPLNPAFFVTNDAIDGEVRRFRPNATAVESAMFRGDYDHWNILSTSGGVMEYLVIHPEGNDPHNVTVGNITWTTNITKGQINAEAYYQHAEGIEIQDGKVSFATKKGYAIFTLDLDEGTFRKLSTKTKEFAGEPDQLKYPQRQDNQEHGEDDQELMYVTEELEERFYAGVHGIDSEGKIFTILRANDRRLVETTGLAFSPDNKHLYVGFLKPGNVFDITRLDGLPFNGKTSSITYNTEKKDKKRDKNDNNKKKKKEEEDRGDDKKKKKKREDRDDDKKKEEDRDDDKKKKKKEEEEDRDNDKKKKKKNRV